MDADDIVIPPCLGVAWDTVILYNDDGADEEESCYPFCDDPAPHDHCLECGERIEVNEFLCQDCR